MIISILERTSLLSLRENWLDQPPIAVCALLLAAIIYPVQFSKDIADGEIYSMLHPVQSAARLTTADGRTFSLSNFSRGDPSLQNRGLTKKKPFLVSFLSLDD